MNDMTGMDAFKMKQSRVSNDAQYISQIIGRFTFCELATVLKVDTDKTHIDCSIGDITYTNVEVIVLGNSAYAVKTIPATGDKVLLLCPRSVITDIQTMTKVDDIPKYDIAGLKCILVADDKANQLFTVDHNKIELTGENKITLDGNGITLEDVNENKFTLDNKGVKIEDKNKNKFTLDDKGVKIEDKNKNTITMDDSGTVINGKLKVKK